MPRKNKIGDALVEMRNATKKGMNKMLTLSGQRGDRDVRLYDRLNSDDLARLTGTLGSNTILGYIRDMELRRLRGDNK